MFLPLLRWDACLYTKDRSRNNKMLKNNEMMEKMENGETVIRMLHHVIIGLRYWSRECTPSWAGDDEGEYTEVTEKYRRKHQTKRSVP